jgi:predicted site-specific integrase-resolvase
MSKNNNLTVNTKNNNSLMKANPQYVSYGKVKAIYGVTPQTLKNWAKNNIIDYKVIKNSQKNTWLYNIDSIGKCINNSTDLHNLTDQINNVDINIINDDIIDETLDSRLDVIYMRISNLHNQEFYELQKNYLINKYGDIPIFEDIDTSMNCNRKNLNKLLDLVFDKKIKNVIIYDSTRISYHGFELFNKICKYNNCTIIIDNDKDEKKLLNDMIFNEFFNDINEFSNNMNNAYKNKHIHKSKNFDHTIIVDSLYNKKIENDQ